MPTASLTKSQVVSSLKDFIQENVFGRGGKIYIRIVPPGRTRGNMGKLVLTENLLKNQPEAIADYLLQAQRKGNSIYLKLPNQRMKRLSLSKLL